MYCLLDKHCSVRHTSYPSPSPGLDPHCYYDEFNYSLTVESV